MQMGQQRIFNESAFVIGFVKTWNNPARIKIQLIAEHESHTLDTLVTKVQIIRSALTGIIFATL